MASVSLPRRRGWGNLRVPCQAPLDRLRSLEKSEGAFFIRLCGGDYDTPPARLTCNRTP
jgi:hypothetical protein